MTNAQRVPNGESFGSSGDENDDLLKFRSRVRSTLPDLAHNTTRDINDYSKATFPTDNDLGGIVVVKNIAELQSALSRLNQAHLKCYPISGGCNWGLGSKSPTDDRSVMLDLRNLKNIRSYDPIHGCISIEAGVSFEEVVHFLGEQDSPFYFPVIGGPPKASVIGNLCERGDGIGPVGDRCKHVTNLEVVLANGEILNTGFSSFGEKSQSLAELTRDVPGPGLHDLFIQSNLGVITAATFWLPRKPALFQGVVFTIKDDQQLEELFGALRLLHQKRLVEENSIAFWSVYKFLAAHGHFPRGAAPESADNESGYTFESLRKSLPKIFKEVEWIGYIPLYAAGLLHGLSVRREVCSALKPFCKKLIVLDPVSTKIAKLFSRILDRRYGVPVKKLIASFYEQSIALGCPNYMNTRSVYWRKATVPPTIDPDRDNVGLHWLCHVLPFEGKAVSQVGEIVRNACHEFGFEPNVAFLNPSSRTLRVFVVLVYDRELSNEELRATNCLQAMRLKLIEKGVMPYRLGIQTMDDFQPQSQTYIDVLRELKNLFDPNHILAPGRYAVKSP